MPLSVQDFSILGGIHICQKNLRSVGRKQSQRVVQRGMRIVLSARYGGVFQSPRRDPQRRNGWARLGFRALFCTRESRMMGQCRRGKTRMSPIVCAYGVTEDLELPDIRDQGSLGSAEIRGSFLAAGLGSPRGEGVFLFLRRNPVSLLKSVVRTARGDPSVSEMGPGRNQETRTTQVVTVEQ